LTTEELVGKVIDALNTCGVDYMVTGSLASNVYGIARMTKDADFVLHLKGDEINAIARSVAPTFRLDGQMAFETVTSTHKQVLRHAKSAFTIELFSLSNDPHDRQRFSRRVAAMMLDRSTWLPTAEDVVIQKLRWSRQGSRPKDLSDAQSVIAVQGDRLDWEYIQSWCSRHDTLELLERLRSNTTG
jgi:hypothetical protein